MVEEQITAWRQNEFEYQNTLITDVAILSLTPLPCHMEGMMWPGTDSVVLPAVCTVLGSFGLIATLVDAGEKDSWF